MNTNDLIKELEPVFSLAGEGFDRFKAECEEACDGHYGKSVVSGNNGQSAVSGDRGQSAVSGDYGKSAVNGDRGQSVVSGHYGACSALGYRAAAKGDLGSLLLASEYIKKGPTYVPVGGRADLIDGKILKPNCWYIVEGGKWVEVDFTDGIFSYVLSQKGGVTKVRTDDGKILFIVRDSEGNAAHGATVKEARADLVYKRVAQFEGELPASATGEEWVGLYRAVTGACAAGVRSFVEEGKYDLSKTYTAQEIVRMTRGAYGADEFAVRVDSDNAD